MEGAPKSEVEIVQQNKIEKKELSYVEKFDVLLGFFGSEKARNAFLEKCKMYLLARAAHEAQVNLGDSENYRKVKNVSYSVPQRAETHNAIMDTIKALATEIKTFTETQEEVIRFFSNREEVAKAIKEYFKDQKERDKEYYNDEDEPDVNRRDMSGPAYFHSLGKEH